MRRHLKVSGRPFPWLTDVEEDGCITFWCGFLKVRKFLGISQTTSLVSLRDCSVFCKIQMSASWIESC